VKLGRQEVQMLAEIAEAEPQAARTFLLRSGPGKERGREKDERVIDK
jgi:hypothetical protein